MATTNDDALPPLTPEIAPAQTSADRTEPGLQPRPARDEVHVWFVCPEPTVSSALVQRCEEVLSADERYRYARFVFEADRMRYLVAHALVRATLSRYAPVAPEQWTFSVTEYGRPEIAGPRHVPRLRFSLSHTRGLTAIAITRAADVGIDVERIEARNHDGDIARRFFATSEVDALEAQPARRRLRAFYDYWTLKEAYIKAIGMGLSVSFQAFAFTLSDPPSIAFQDPALGDPSAWHFARPAIADGHACAIALRNARAPRVLARRTIPLVNDSSVDMTVQNDNSQGVSWTSRTSTEFAQAKAKTGIPR